MGKVKVNEDGKSRKRSFKVSQIPTPLFKSKSESSNRWSRRRTKVKMSNPKSKLPKNSFKI
jgi:hypothetical protein